eukprot:TRINITY_DN1946_c0_g1_i1.p2 TRINITY_DN1946_c0_g1~~TRINITY_DN1946_c0_g1_i1.p2  ORF type:complete len:50 (-),score=9.94 TRINITY_DN1946_c0_g1_i1:165-314(-)
MGGTHCRNFLFSMSGPPGLEMKKKEDNVTIKRKIEEKLTLSLKTRQPFR